MTATATTPTQLAYKVVPMTHDFDSLLATIATITGKSSPRGHQENRRRKRLLPRARPVLVYGDDVLIAKIFAALGWVSSVWKEAGSLAELPSFGAGARRLRRGNRPGRFVMFYRQLVNPPSKREVSVLLDPAYWLAPNSAFVVTSRTSRGRSGLSVSQMSKGCGKVSFATKPDRHPLGCWFFVLSLLG